MIINTPLLPGENILEKRTNFVNGLPWTIQFLKMSGKNTSSLNVSVPAEWPRYIGAGCSAQWVLKNRLS